MIQDHFMKVYNIIKVQKRTFFFLFFFFVIYKGGKNTHVQENKCPRYDHPPSIKSIFNVNVLL